MKAFFRPLLEWIVRRLTTILNGWQAADEKIIEAIPVQQEVLSEHSENYFPGMRWWGWISEQEVLSPRYVQWGVERICQQYDIRYGVYRQSSLPSRVIAPPITRKLPPLSRRTEDLALEPLFGRKSTALEDLALLALGVGHDDDTVETSATMPKRQAKKFEGEKDGRGSGHQHQDHADG